VKNVQKWWKNETRKTRGKVLKNIEDSTPKFPMTLPSFKDWSTNGTALTQEQVSSYINNSVWQESSEKMCRWFAERFAASLGITINQVRNEINRRGVLLGKKSKLTEVEKTAQFSDFNKRKGGQLRSMPCALTGLESVELIKGEPEMRWDPLVFQWKKERPTLIILSEIPKGKRELKSDADFRALIDPLAGKRVSGPTYCYDLLFSKRAYNLILNYNSDLVSLQTLVRLRKTLLRAMKIPDRIGFNEPPQKLKTQNL
jgi:hypothetical protein